MKKVVLVAVAGFALIAATVAAGIQIAGKPMTADERSQWEGQAKQARQAERVIDQLVDRHRGR